MFSSALQTPRTPVGSKSKPPLPNRPINLNSPAKLPDSPASQRFNNSLIMLRCNLVKCINDLASDGFRDAKCYEFRKLSKQMADNDEFFATLVMKFTAEKKEKNIKDMVYHYVKAWEEFLSRKAFNSGHKFLYCENPAFLHCPQNLVKTAARSDPRYADLKFDSNSVIGGPKDQSNSNTQGSEAESEDVVDKFIQNAVEENVASAAVCDQDEPASEAQKKAINVINGSLSSSNSTISSIGADSVFSSGGNSNSSGGTSNSSGGNSNSSGGDSNSSGGHPNTGVIQANLQHGPPQSGTQIFNFRPTSVSEPATSSTSIGNKRKKLSDPGEDDSETQGKSRKIGESDLVLEESDKPNVLKLLLQIGEHTKDFNANCQKIATKTVNEYHDKVFMPNVNALKNSNEILTAKVKTAEETVENFVKKGGLVDQKVLAAVEEKWSSVEPSTYDEQSGVSENIVYAGYTRKRKNYSNACREAVEAATIKLDFSAFYTERNNETFKIKHNVLKDYLKAEYDVKRTWTRVDTNNKPKGLSAIVEIRDGFLKKREQLAVEAVLNRKDSNSLGVNFVIPDEYDCSDEFFDWKSRNIITNFTITKDARYILILQGPDGDVVLRVGYPLELLKLPDKNAEILKENLIKLADFSKFFVHNGKVLPVPEKYVERQLKRNERALRFANNPNQRSNSNNNNDKKYNNNNNRFMSKSKKVFPPLNITGFDGVTGGATLEGNGEKSGQMG